MDPAALLAHYRRAVDLWRRHRLDAAIIALVLLVLATALPGATSAQALGAVASAMSLLVFLARRVQPLAVSLLAFGAGCLGISQSPDITAVQFVGVLVVFALVGAVNSERDAVLGWAAGALTMAYATSREPAGGRLGDFALTMTFCTMIWAAGLLVSRRDRTARESEERARDAEHTRAEHARAATSAERARIATELHDIVSHGLSVVIVQTVAARQLLDGDGADPTAREADRRMASVESTAREALADMRRMLGLLQSTTESEASSASSPGTSAEDIGPNPGVQSLPALLDRARASGISVTTSGIASLPAVPAALSLTTYRIVQECLTNVIKHAPGAAVTVDVGQRAGALHVTVMNTAGPAGIPHRPPGQPPVGAGRGLIGLQQRVSVYGGTCRAEALDDGGFRVAVTLPWDATAALDQPDPLRVEHSG